MLSCVRLFVTPWTLACQASLFIANSWDLLAHAHQVGDAIQPSLPLWSPSPLAFNLSQHWGLSSESVLCIRWPKSWSFNISPSNEYSGLISFRIGWFDLTVQGVVVQVQVGKEFPDVRQNEREIKFIRAGDAIRTVGQLKGEPTLNRGP